MNGRDPLQRAVFTAGDPGPFLASQYIVAVNFVKLQIQALEYSRFHVVVFIHFLKNQINPLKLI